MLLWLWCRLVAVAPIQPLSWKLPYAMGVALKSKKKKKKKKNKKKIFGGDVSHGIEKIYSLSDI